MDWKKKWNQMKEKFSNKSVVKLTRLHQPSKIIDSVTTK